MSDMREAVMAMPDHLRDAIWRIESARLTTMEAPMAIVCGMGGSAIGGDLGAAALGDRLTRQMFTVRSYELPPWSPAGSAVLCSSYSGDTEETLACYDAAEALGAQRLVATTGGELAFVGPFDVQLLSAAWAGRAAAEGFLVRNHVNRIAWASRRNHHAPLEHVVHGAGEHPAGDVHENGVRVDELDIFLVLIA